MFEIKIKCYMDSIATKLQGSTTPFDFDLPHSGEVLSDFTPVTPAEVSQLLRSMSNKSSPLDYIPTSLLKSCADTFSILISHLANLSFTQATIPSKFKLALISPLLKKPGLPKSDLDKFQTNIKSEYHRQNPWASCPFTFFSSRFKISQFFSFTICLS